MTSLEMVEYINSQRQEGEAELRHADFLAKVPKVLGRDERNFSSVYLGGNGQERPCYRFPKREACLMAMSYSYELQAKVFDRMTELEKGIARIPTSFADALRLAAEQAERIEKQQAQLAVAEPKALVFDSSMADKSMSVSRFAKNESESALTSTKITWPCVSMSKGARPHPHHGGIQPLPLSG